jgi:hypothetical protein
MTASVQMQASHKPLWNSSPAEVQLLLLIPRQNLGAQSTSLGSTPLQLAATLVCSGNNSFGTLLMMCVAFKAPLHEPLSSEQRLARSLSSLETHKLGSLLLVMAVLLHT